MIREMNHRWPGMRIGQTLNNVVSYLESYIGCSLLAEVNAKAEFGRRSDPVRDYLVSLIFKRRIAESPDLELMADLLPDDFQKLRKLATTRTLRVQTGVPPDSIDKLQTALARSVQEYLFTKHQLYVARLQAARELRQFIHQLKHRLYTKRLFGFAEEQVAEWNATDRRELARKRQKRLRARKKSAQSRVTRSPR
jgi:hypothetical protein